MRKYIPWIFKVLFVALLPFTYAYAGTDITLKDEVRDFLLESIPWNGDEVMVEEIEFRGYNPAKDIYDDVEMRLPKRTRVPGRITFPVKLLRDGKEIKSLWASAKVKVMKDVVVSLRPLRMREKIGREDVRIVSMEVTEVPKSAAMSIEDVVGKIVKRPIGAGMVVKTDYIKPEAIIRRGDSVVVRVEGRLISIKSSAVAMEDGYKGGTIMIRTSYGKRVFARVAGPGEVVIDF